VPQRAQFVHRFLVEIPGYALLPDGTPVPTSVFYKRL
jgi:hypothetical protein